MEFKDKAIQAEYDDLQEEARDLEEQLKVVERNIQHIVDIAEQV